MDETRELRVSFMRTSNISRRRQNPLDYLVFDIPHVAHLGVFLKTGLTIQCMDTLHRIHLVVLIIFVGTLAQHLQ